MYEWHYYKHSILYVIVTDCPRIRVSPRARMQFSESFPRQLAADGEPWPGVRHRYWWSAPVAADVRSAGLQGQTPTTNCVHRCLHLQKRMVRLYCVLVYVRHRDVLQSWPNVYRDTLGALNGFWFLTNVDCWFSVIRHGTKFGAKMLIDAQIMAQKRNSRWRWSEIRNHLGQGVSKLLATTTCEVV